MSSTSLKMKTPVDNNTTESVDNQNQHGDNVEDMNTSTIISVDEDNESPNNFQVPMANRIMNPSRSTTLETYVETVTLSDNVDLEASVSKTKLDLSKDPDALKPPLTISSTGIGSTTSSPEETAKWWTIPTLSWLTPFIQNAAKKPVQFTDLFKLRSKFEAEGLTSRMQRWINDAVEKFLEHEKVKGRELGGKEFEKM
ncbi:hypothetical protein HDU76_012149, partial [Blyttiomyces sp. JEL0837]